MIKIENISKSFSDLTVLKEINLEIKKGNTLVILGKSGTGKSVLLKILIGLLKPDSGLIYVNDTEVTKITVKKLNVIRKKIGFLFQNAALYDSLSVRENLEFALRNHPKKSGLNIEERVIKYLKAVSLFSAIDKMPSELSGGMRKRVGLARSLIIEPEIMLYDEPTTGLDPITTREISRLIRDVQTEFNLTSIVVTHDMECARIICDDMALLSEGNIAFKGTYNDFEHSENAFVKQFIGR